MAEGIFRFEDLPRPRVTPKVGSPDFWMQKANGLGKRSPFRALTQHESHRRAFRRSNWRWKVQAQRRFAPGSAMDRLYRIARKYGANPCQKHLFAFVGVSLYLQTSRAGRSSIQTRVIPLQTRRTGFTTKRNGTPCVRDTSFWKWKTLIIFSCSSASSSSCGISYTWSGS